MENLEIYNSVRAVPETALKTIKFGALNGFSDINPMWRIKKLTETFGVCGIGWYTKIIDKQIIEGAGGEKSAFVDIELFIKVDGEWSQPIFGTGGSSFVGLGKGVLKTSDECFKMAYTDAISVACKALGIGADVYFEKDRTKYDQQQERQEQATTAKAPKLPKSITIEPAPVVDLERLKTALAAVAASTDTMQVSSVWNSYADLKANSMFKDAVAAKGKELKERQHINSI